MFKKLEGDTVLVVQKGAYMVADLHQYRGWLFLSLSNKFYRIYKNGGTTKSDLNVVELHTDHSLYADKFQRLVLTKTDHPVIIDEDAQGKMKLVSHKR